MPYWNAKPSPMPNIGAKYGRKATWIGASGDQTFLRIDEALINSHVLATSEIFASKHIIGLVPSSVSEPPPFKCLLINKMDGSCRTFNDSEQEDLQGFGLCLDPVYDVIWRSVQGLFVLIIQILPLCFTSVNQYLLPVFFPIFKDLGNTFYGQD